MKYFKKMIGEKCYLSPMHEDDVPLYTRWLNDMEVTWNLKPASRNISLLFEREFLPSMIKNHNYAIVENEHDTLIGNCGLINHDQLNKHAEVGIFIGNKEYWGKGYGTEALKLFLDYVFRFLNLRNMMLTVYSFNERAIKCYKKVGFKEIGRRRKALLRNMEEYDIVYMDILNDEFMALHGKKRVSPGF